MLDDSGSMWGETDNDGWRVDAVELLAISLGVDRSQADFKMAVIPFNTEASVLGNQFYQLGIVAERDKLIERLSTDRVKPVGDNRWTDAKAALTAAQTLLQNAHSPDYRTVIVMLTDGRPETLERNPKNNLAGWQAYKDEIKKLAINQFVPFASASGRCPDTGNVPLYTMVIGNATRVQAYLTEENAAFWGEIGKQTNGNVYNLSAENEMEFQRNLQTEFDQLATEMLCSAEFSEQPFQEIVGTELFTFDIDAIDETVTFTVAKTRDAVDVTIYNPNGDPVATSGEVDPAFQDIYSAEYDTGTRRLSESWGFQRPTDPDASWEGEWGVELITQEDNVAANVEARISARTASETTLSLVDPLSNSLPTEGNIFVALQLTAEENVTIDVNSVTLVLTCDEGGELTSQPTDTKVIDNLIMGVINLTGNEVGSCQLKADAALGDGTIVTNASDVTLNALTPRLEIVEPVSGNTYSGLNKVAVRFKTGNQDYPADAGRDTVEVAISDEQGQQIAILDLQPDTSGQYEGDVWSAELAEPLASGTYSIQAEFIAQPFGIAQALPSLKFAQGFTIDNQEVIVPSTPAPTDTPIRPTDTSTPPTLTPTDPTVEPTSTPAPAQPIFAEIPTWVMMLCGGVVLLAVIAFFLFQQGDGRSANIPTGALIDETGGGNGNYIGQRRNTMKITDLNGEQLATLTINPLASGPRIEVRTIASGIELFHEGIPVEGGSVFDPQHGDIIEVGDVTLRYQSDGDHQQVDEDEFSDNEYA
ncbi:MAG: vWA domain-containing protein [Candidatus Promineifilaceae bacterium]